MLILDRGKGQDIVIGGDRPGQPLIVITVNRIKRGRVILGVEAPSDVRIVRQELERFDTSKNEDET